MNRTLTAAALAVATILASSAAAVGLDDDIPFGSGISDRDYATHTVVMQNQIHVNQAADMIRVANTAVNSPNFIDYNETVTPETVVIRLAGCYVGGESIDFIEHGASYDLGTIRLTCSDGNLQARPLRPPRTGVQESY